MILIVIIICVTILEVIALHNGIDGKVLSSVVGLFSLIAGFQIKKYFFTKRGEK